LLSIRIPCPSYDDQQFGKVFFPGLKVHVRLADGTFQPFEFILDSGADCTIVPRHMANLVGFKLPLKTNASISGITGRPLLANTGKMTLKIQNEEFEVRCLFTRSNRTPLLLGRVDFFSLFNIQFDGRNCHITLERIP
jgi:hypothetical protein